MSKTEKTSDNHEQGNSSLGVVMPCFSKEQVIRIVAEFGRTYNTERFLGNGETLNEAIEEVKDLIDWDVANKA